MRPLPLCCTRGIAQLRRRPSKARTGTLAHTVMARQPGFRAPGFRSARMHSDDSGVSTIWRRNATIPPPPQNRDQWTLFLAAKNRTQPHGNTDIHRNRASYRIRPIQPKLGTISIYANRLQVFVQMHYDSHTVNHPAPTVRVTI